MSTATKTPVKKLENYALGKFVSGDGRMLYNAITGVYSQTIPNKIGCDSNIGVNVTVNTIDIAVSQASVVLTANENGATYQWINCPSNTAITGATAQTYTATVNGNYAVVVTKNSCSDTRACVNVNTVGINQFEDSSSMFEVYPNPTKGIVELQMTNYELKNIKIVNVLGETVANYSLSTNRCSIDLSNQPKRFYFIQLIINERTITQRFVIE